MPIYVYEPENHECLICEGRFDCIQSVSEEALKYCPTCGLEVKRVISRVQFRLDPGVDPDRAASKGFTTFKRSEKGVWEKVSGPGVDAIVGTPEDVAAVESEKTKPNVLDLDAES